MFSASPTQMPDGSFPKTVSSHREDIEGLYLNIRYDGKGLTCITGTSLKLFTLDRTLELAWTG